MWEWGSAPLPWVPLPLWPLGIPGHPERGTQVVGGLTPSTYTVTDLLSKTAHGCPLGTLLQAVCVCVCVHVCMHTCVYM